MRMKQGRLARASDCRGAPSPHLGMETVGSRRQAFIFQEDPKTGTFEFIGTKPAMGQRLRS